MESFRCAAENRLFNESRSLEPNAELKNGRSGRGRNMKMFTKKFFCLHLHKGTKLTDRFHTGHTLVVEVGGVGVIILMSPSSEHKILKEFQNLVKSH